MGQQLPQGQVSPGISPQALEHGPGYRDQPVIVCKPQLSSWWGLGVCMGRGLAEACVSTWIWGHTTQQEIPVGTEQRTL